MPALFKLYGSECIFTPVNDRPRERGVSKSDFAGRAIKGFFDLMGVLVADLPDASARSRPRDVGQ